MKRPPLLSYYRFTATAIVLLAALTAPARGVTPDEMLRDPALEERARALSRDLRCVVCQNQSIDDSNAPLARDLRLLLRERLTAGDTDNQAVDYIVARYGNFVLLKPPIQTNTLLLWAGPALFLIFAIVGAAHHLRNRGKSPPAEEVVALSVDEQAQFDALFDKRGSI